MSSTVEPRPAALPFSADAAAAERRLVEVATLAAGEPVVAAELATLDVCGTATALGMAGRHRPARQTPSPPSPAGVLALLDRLAGAPRLDRAAVLDAHRRLATNVPRPRRGRFRTAHVAVTAPDRPDLPEFVAPPPALVPALVDDTLAVANRTDASPLAVGAVAFARFVRAHPFEDGNGRVGRLLLAVVLRRRLGIPFVAPTGLVLCANRAALGDALARFARGDVDGWVSFVAERATQAAAAATTTLRARSPA